MWLLNREGGEAQQLTDTIQDVENFAWSPASDRLVLVLQDPSPEEIEAAESKAKDAKAKPKPRPWVIDRLHFKEDEIGYLDRRRTHLYVFTIADHKQTADYFGGLRRQRAGMVTGRKQDRVCEQPLDAGAGHELQHGHMGGGGGQHRSG